MSTLKRGKEAIWDQVVPPSYNKTLPSEASGVYPSSESASQMQIQYATAEDLQRAWDCDLWHLSRSPINPDLKPLTGEELEALVTRFPDVMTHIYIRPDAVLFRTATSEATLIEVLRCDLVFPGEVQIHVHARRGFDLSEWCGHGEGTVDALAFNTLRVTAIHQTLAPELHRS